MACPHETKWYHVEIGLWTCGECHVEVESPEAERRRLDAEALAKVIAPLLARPARPERAPAPPRRQALVVGKREAARLLGVNRTATLEPAIKAGTIHTARVNGQVRIERSEIERLIATGFGRVKAVQARKARSKSKEPPHAPASDARATIGDRIRQIPID